jgi:hypothetical protein
MYKRLGMRSRRRGRVARLASALAFIVTITMGLLVGYAWTVEEEIESRFRSNKRDSTRVARR